MTDQELNTKYDEQDERDAELEAQAEANDWPSQYEGELWP